MKVPIVDGKLAKSLMVHNLDNLVYQKRQRKTVQPLIPQINTIAQKNTKQKVPSQTKQLKSKKVLIKKHKKVQTKTQTIKKTKKIVRKGRIIRVLKNGKIKKGAKLSQNKKEKIVKKPQIISKNEKGDNKGQKPEALSKQKKVNEKKDQKICKQELIKAEENVKTQIKKKGRPKKIISQIQIERKQDIEEQPQIVVESLPINKNPIQSQIIEEQFGSTRTRRAKVNSVKRYTQNQIFEAYEEQIQKYDPQYRTCKKKKINVQRQKNYNINRIFRKQPKLQLKSIQIMANLDTISLNLVAHKFGEFDFVHSSLPISVLMGMNQIPNLIQKGFMFIWVQRGETGIGYHLMNRWGFDIIDQIIWIKCQEQTRNIIYQGNQTTDDMNVTNQNLFLNCKSLCLVGYKCPNGQKAQYRTKISNNIIFAKPKLDPIQKPDEIFEIADLLMPGSKKLELGGPPQSGWLSVNHQQDKFYRCWSCLKDLQKVKQLKAITNSNIAFGVFCYQCQILLNQNQEINNCSNFTQNKAIVINNINYEKEDHECICSSCKKNSNQLLLCATCQKGGLCQQCLIKQFKKHVNHQMSILYKKQTAYQQQQLKCSQCQKNTLADFYYECQNYTCKLNNHVMCQQCFWNNSRKNQINQGKDMELMIQEKDEPLKKSYRKVASIHEWKIKKIVTCPLLKNQCFSCKSQLKLPYHCCQNCLGWTWCGKCKVTNSQTHPHSQKHNLFLMI